MITKLWLSICSGAFKMSQLWMHVKQNFKKIFLAKENKNTVTRQNQPMLLFPLHIKFHMKVLMYSTIPQAVRETKKPVKEQSCAMFTQVATLKTYPKEKSN